MQMPTGPQPEVDSKHTENRTKKKCESERYSDSHFFFYMYATGKNPDSSVVNSTLSGSHQ